MDFQSQIALLTNRLNKLETDNKRLRQSNYWIRLGGGILMVVLVLFSVVGAKSLDRKQVEASRFVLSDEDGKPRAEWGFEKGEPFLALGDTNGKRRVMMTVTKNGPRVILANAEAIPQLLVQCTNDKSEISLKGGDTDWVAFLNADKDDAGLPLQQGKDCKTRVEMTANRISSFIHLHDNEENPRVTLQYDGAKINYGGLSMWDNKRRRQMSLFSSGEANVLDFNNKEGATRSRLGIIHENGTVFQLFDKDGKVFFMKKEEP